MRLSVAESTVRSLMTYANIQRAFILSSLIMAFGTICALQYATTEPVEFGFEYLMAFAKLMTIFSMVYGFVYFTVGLVFC